MNAKLPERTTSILRSQQAKPTAVHKSYPPEQLALQIKTARKDQKLTLKSLSDKSGVAVSTLSKIENNQISPTFQAVQQLTQALKLDLPQLLANPGGGIQLSRRALTPHNEGVCHLTPTYEHKLLASELTHKKMLPFTSKIRARSIGEFDGWVQHQGEEFFMVLRGSLELHCEYYEPVQLNEGDSSYFDSTMGHALVSTSQEDAEVLWVVSIN